MAVYVCLYLYAPYTSRCFSEMLLFVSVCVADMQTMSAWLLWKQQDTRFLCPCILMSFVFGCIPSLFRVYDCLTEWASNITQCQPEY